MPIFFESPACPTNCKECKVKDARNTECNVNKCDVGYGLKDSNKTCIQCPTHCQTCTDVKKDGVMVCDTCSFYYQLNDGQCAACPPNCLECSESNGAMVCSKCQSHHVMMDDKSCKG
ncbi:hypothetical protein NP493_925g02012 [Ridgeia piscesae]|uniref:Uncharacterized protein n=1 Tax=Ridgeia piscesae TaxID=27915 RepID=A0AAD9KJM8_RIDPI|nr:hypothetical protein NP493_925g02012 [Ridgeia piscesae]